MTSLKVVLAALVSMLVAATVSPQIQEIVDPCKVLPCQFGGPR